MWHMATWDKHYSNAIINNSKKKKKNLREQSPLDEGSPKGNGT